MGFFCPKKRISLPLQRGGVEEETVRRPVLHRRERKEAEWRVKGEGCENAWNLVKQSAGQL